MATTSPAIRQHGRGFKRMLLTMLFVSCLGWLSLFVWSCSVWMRDGFESAAMAIHRVSIEQRQTLSAFDDASWLSVLSDRLSASTKGQVDGLTQRARFMQANIARQAASQWQTHMGSHRVAEGDTMREVLNDAYLHGAQCWYLVCASFHTLRIKTLMLVASIPLFLWASVAGLVDGLNQRAIRTACLGRESTYVFHRSMPFVRRVMLIVLGGWLSIPVVLPPSLVFVSLAVMVSMAVSISASRFKKYV